MPHASLPHARSTAKAAVAPPPTWWPMRTHSVGEEKTESVVFEDFVGGRVYERIRGGEESMWESTWGTIVHWEPPHRVVFTWHPGRSPEQAQEVELRFTAEGTGSRLELTHSKWERMGAVALKARRNYALGWAYVIRLGAGRGNSPVVWGIEALTWALRPFMKRRQAKEEGVS